MIASPGLAPNPAEVRMARLHSARAWLRARGVNSKPAGFVADTPIPRYCVTGIPNYLSAKGVIRLAEARGWNG